MKNKTFFCDLDGTLLGMNQDQFLALYFTSIKDYLVALKHDPQVFFYYLDKGIKAMLNNTGQMTNEAAFINATAGYKDLLNLMLDYYQKDFIKAKASCYVNPASVALIKYLKENNYKIVLATNPLFPRFVTEMRVKWAGLCPSDFNYITSYENSSYTKPKKEYYFEILSNLNLKPNEVVYIGNDVDDDFREIKNDTFESYLITDCLINKKEVDLKIPQMSMQEFLAYVKENA